MILVKMHDHNVMIKAKKIITEIMILHERNANFHEVLNKEVRKLINVQMMFKRRF